MSGSSFSSRQMVVIFAIMLPFNFLFGCIVVLAMYASIARAKKRGMGKGTNTNVVAESELSGLSVIEESVIAINGNRNIQNECQRITF